MGYSVLDMLFQLDISLLEVLFIYTRWRLRVGYISITLSILCNCFCPVVNLLLIILFGWYRQEKVGHLVEWVEKDSFTRLNKLFKIDGFERNHNVLLSDKNLMVLINDLKPFIIPVFPHVAFPSLVASEHFVLKDLSFYEVVRLADLKARQTRLELWEKKRQEGHLGKLLLMVVHSPILLSIIRRRRWKNLLLGLFRRQGLRLLYLFLLHQLHLPRHLHLLQLLIVSQK